jgi:hypothetical protein
MKPKCESKIEPQVNAMRKKALAGERIGKELKNLITNKNFQPIHKLKSVVQFDKSAAMNLEEQLSEIICTKEVKINDIRYVVTLYFLPITLTKLPSNVTEIIGDRVSFPPVLPARTCFRVGEILKRYLTPVNNDQIKILSGLLNLDRIVSAEGIQFVDRLSEAIANDERKEQGLNEAIEVIADYDALSKVMLTECSPEDHRALLFYTVTEDNNYIDSKIHSQEIYRSLMSGRVEHLNTELYRKLDAEIRECYFPAQINDKYIPSIIACCSPPQTYAHLKVSQFGSILLTAVMIGETVWHGVARGKFESRRVGEYLSMLAFEINCVDDSGSFVLKQIYTPTHRYNYWNELEMYGEALQLLLGVDFTITHC